MLYVCDEAELLMFFLQDARGDSGHENHGEELHEEAQEQQGTSTWVMNKWKYCHSTTMITLGPPRTYTCLMQLLQRLLNSRQLGLKLVANTTFGYTAASYSGRMPCIEIADSIVQKGRETLERAIHLVNNSPSWGGRVVYGDTDSLFVLLKGASKDEAFRIGKEICERVTAENPKPVKLKFEKVKGKRMLLFYLVTPSLSRGLL